MRRTDTQNIWKANTSSIEHASSHLAIGRLIGVPTETVYGLAADARNAKAVAEIFEIKGRPHFNPLIVHVLSTEDAAAIVRLDNCANKIISAFWPGPLTIVLPRQPDAQIADLVSAGLPTLAVRAPAHPVARQLLESFGRPFVAPSANKSGRMSPTAAAHVVEEFGASLPTLDGGPCTDGVESTIISLTDSQPKILRPGVITKAQLEAVLGHPVSQETGGEIQAPGMMTSHYAPSASLRLNVTTPTLGERLLGFGGIPHATLDLSPDGNLREAAANLFSYLRKLDETPGPIAVAPIPMDGLGAAINDRLTRAAAPKG
ncbi:MAG: L-threonylcarbamoyladenylate synthase [Pseudomonadota bacterium]